MPINKNALLRYQILDRCFSDRHHKYEIEELVDKVNEAFLDIYGTTVSLRQIRADITHMRDRIVYDAPIEAVPIDGRKCYYRYSDPDFSRRCVKMHTFCFLRTKPRLSQAGALLLPKDFVSLGIRISL